LLRNIHSPFEDSNPSQFKTTSSKPVGLDIGISSKLISSQCCRSGAESGWDFSSRWLGDGKNLSTIQAEKVVPVDLNCTLDEGSMWLYIYSGYYIYIVYTHYIYIYIISNGIPLMGIDYIYIYLY
jgi:hypothetical protein